MKRANKQALILYIHAGTALIAALTFFYIAVTHRMGR